MKTLIIFLSLIISGFQLNHAQAKIEILDSIHDFDTIQKFGKVSYDYQFINSGNEPLVISNVKTSCGCDVPSYNKEPVLPGDTILVNYKYDSKRVGPINKTMTITSNAVNAPYIVVRAKGFIE